MTAPTMRALQYRSIGAGPELVEIPRPVPGPGEVLLRVSAAGACHSDLYLMNLPAEQYRHGLPLTLGHEGAGTVAELGPGVTGVELDEPVLVFGAWGCGACRQCRGARENRCSRVEAAGVTRPGLGAPGAMADYLIVDSPRHLLPLGDLDPVAAVSLTDAGLTPFHAIAESLPKLHAGSTAVVIGIGGLGHVAVQILRAMTPARVMAIDRDRARLDRALELGAHEAVLSDAEARTRLADLTSGDGVEVVLDMVASQATLDLSRDIVATGGDVVIVGVGAGTMPLAFRRIAVDASVRVPFWGSFPDLVDVVALARSGQIQVDVTRFSLDQAAEAYALLDRGAIQGRAVIVP